MAVVAGGNVRDASAGEDGDDLQRSVFAVAYWAAWVAFGVWGFRFPFVYRRNALWMVLAVFLFTHGDILPAYRVRRPLRPAALLLASIACSMLLYCTSDWWFSVFEWWRSSSSDPWVRQTLQRLWFPTMYIWGTLLTACVLIIPFKRTLREFTSPALATIGVFTTLLVQSDLTLRMAAWRHDWSLSALLLFRALIVGLGTAAIAGRIRSPESPYSWCPLCRRIWRGAISISWGIGIYFFSILASLGFLVFFAEYDTRGADGSLLAGKQLTLVVAGEVLPSILFLAGSLIALRTFAKAAVRRPRSSHIARALIVIIFIPIAVNVARSTGLLIGAQLQSSMAVMFGTAYSYHLTPDGAGLVFDGNVTYGVAARLKGEIGRQPAVRRLILNSGGGLVDEASAAADIIAHAQLDTVVEKSCESACVLMFLAGMHRTVVPPGKLGFHRFVPLNPLAAGGNGASCGEYAQYGVTRDFCSKVDAFIPPAMWYPTEQELLAAHVISAPAPVTR